MCFKALWAIHIKDVFNEPILATDLINKTLQPSVEALLSLQGFFLSFESKQIHWGVDNFCGYSSNPFKTLVLWNLGSQQSRTAPSECTYGCSWLLACKVSCVSFFFFVPEPRKMLHRSPRSIFVYCAGKTDLNKATFVEKNRHMLW